MATIFSKFFHSPKSVVQPDEKAPSQNLFVASEPPALIPENNGSIIKQFLHQDHYSAGLVAGFNMHSQEDLSFQKNCLKCNFQHTLSSLQEQMQDELLDKSKKLIQIGDLLPTQKQLLGLEIRDINDKLEKMNIQKALSVDGEGWISGTLNDFERGYKKGLQDFITERTFLTRNLI
jgi:hypothetical protein